MTKEEIFRNIASKTSGKDCNYLPGCCPDQYVGIVEKLKPEENFHRENIFKSDTKNIEKDFSACEHVIILILESPHKDEFDKNGEPIGPANGITGMNIRNYLKFNEEDEKGIFKNIDDYHLILMNAIPFQCSLGLDLNNNKPNQKTRDDVFKAAWDNDNDAIGKEFFEGRLEKLLDKLQKNSKNVVIVNACTGAKGNSREPLCCKVCKSIVNVLENYCDEKECHIEFYHIHHPSTWNQINRTRNEKFWETDCVAVNPNSDDNSDEIEFNCKENKYWEKYLDTENLACSCFGKLEY